MSRDNLEVIQFFKNAGFEIYEDRLKSHIDEIFVSAVNNNSEEIFVDAFFSALIRKDGKFKTQSIRNVQKFKDNFLKNTNWYDYPDWLFNFLGVYYSEIFTEISIVITKGKEVETHIDKMKPELLRGVFSEKEIDEYRLKRIFDEQEAVAKMKEIVVDKLNVLKTKINSSSQMKEFEEMCIDSVCKHYNNYKKDFF